MASDLSKLVQESITLTLNGLLAKDAKILQVTKTHIKDIQDLQVLQVQSNFNFSNFSSELSFIVPAKSSSLIFNTMMGSPITDLAEDIDEDTEDAIGEFISNTSGTLTTSINGADFEDIGQTKFNIAHKEILKGNDLKNIEHTFRFLIDLEDNELIVFITFDESILPYIEEISASEITHHEETVEEEIEEETIEEVKQVNEQTEVNLENDQEIRSEDNEEKSEEIDPKQKKLKIIVFAVAGLLGFILVAFLVMYLMGAFDNEPIVEKKEDLNTTKVTKDPNQPDIVKYKTVKKVIFNTSDINKERLNGKLAELTKYKVLNKEELEAQKLAEKNRLFELEKEKELLEFSKQNQEEPLFEKKELEQPRIIDKKTKFTKETFAIKKDDIIITNNTPIINEKIESTNKEDNIIKKEEIINEDIIDSLKYVVTNSLKYSLFKKLVQQTQTNQARISICNNNQGKTTIYIGPFENETLQENMKNLIIEKNPAIKLSLENITEEEFNIRCNLE